MAVALGRRKSLLFSRDGVHGIAKMTDRDSERIGPHALGELPAGEIDRSEHDSAYWELKVDAMVMLLRSKVLDDFAPIRRAIESLPADAYDRLSYYERWAYAAAVNAMDAGLVTREELDERIALMKSKTGNQ